MFSCIIFHSEIPIQLSAKELLQCMNYLLGIVVLELWLVHNNWGTVQSNQAHILALADHRFLELIHQGTIFYPALDSCIHLLNRQSNAKYQHLRRLAPQKVLGIARNKKNGKQINA